MIIKSKTVFLTEDFTVMSVIERDRCLLVQQYDYSLSRARDSSGLPYGDTSGSTLRVTINTSTNVNTRALYRLLGVNEPTQFSIVNNAMFDELGRLVDYDSAMVAEGYVVSLDEGYDSQMRGGGNNNATMDICILCVAVQYVGERTMNENGQVCVSKLIRRF